MSDIVNNYKIDKFMVDNSPLKLEKRLYCINIKVKSLKI